MTAKRGKFFYPPAGEARSGPYSSQTHTQKRGPKMKRILAIAGTCVLAAGITALAGCGSSSPSACDIKISTSVGAAYMSITNPGGSVSSSTCNSINSSSGSSAGTTSSVVSSIPSNAAKSCTGTSDGLSYTVYGDGSSIGSTLASAACASINGGT